MKKFLKRVITSFVIMSCFCTAFIFSVNAADAETVLKFNPQTPTLGQTVTVTVSVNTVSESYNATLELRYDPDLLEFQSTNAGLVNSAGAGIVKISPAPNTKKYSYTFNFKTIASGVSMIAVNGMAYGMDDEWVISQSYNMTISDASKSDNANLKSLSLSNGSLSPSFSASRTSYTATVANSVTQCRVYATASDSDAKVSVSGDSALKVGKNTRTVTVTAPSGAQKTYTITITRLAENEEPTDSSDTDTSGTESTEEPTGNPLETTVDGGTFTVATDIAGVTLHEGFKVSSADYNGEQVATAEDSGKNFVIYYLCPTDSDELVPYIMNESGTAFERLKYADFAGKIYIFTNFPKDMSAPEGYYETTVKIGDFDMPAYAGTEDGYSDFYYLYGFFDGGFRVYRYDSAENMLQRYPEFKLTGSSAETELAPDAGIAERFGSLSSNAKVIVIGLVIAVIGAAALAVLLIVKLIRSRNTLPDDYELEDMFANSPDVTGTLNGGKDSDNTGDDIYSKK